MVRSNYNITGLFYEIQGYKFRKYLNIKNVQSMKQIPDLMVVMMNPGSSKPVDGIENNTIESLAIPDRTQDQIMKVMADCNFEYARVLNLSDIREPKSKKLFSKMAELDAKGIPHSIFDTKRKNDFDSLFTQNIPVIFAWGVDKKLQFWAEKAINAMRVSNPAGIVKKGLGWAYYHPLPQNYNKQKEWVSGIISLIN